MNIWEGVYKNFDESRRIGPGFSSNTWIKKSTEKISKTLKTACQKKIVPNFVTYNDSLLPVVSAMLYAQKGKLGILDFGGNFGLEFLKVIHSAGTEPKKIDYHVLDNKSICNKASRLFQKDKRIHFHHVMPENIPEVDIVHLGSSLQYIEDWQKLLQELANLKPMYILFTDLSAGEIPTYSSVQNYYGSKIPMWFFNVKEVVKKMDGYGYKLIFKSQIRSSFLGKEQNLPQENFPKKFKLKNSCNLLFLKK